MTSKSGNLILDNATTETLENKIISMVKNKIFEQNEYLSSRIIEDHIYEVGEKSSGRVLLYDLDGVGSGSDGIGEIEFPQELYDRVGENGRVVFNDGGYQIVGS